jgi:hypothetical protein
VLGIIIIIIIIDYGDDDDDTNYSDGGRVSWSIFSWFSFQDSFMQSEAI